MNQLRFRTRLVLILSLFAIVPALVLTLLWSGTVSSVVPFVTGQSAWDSVAASGERAIAAARQAPLTASQRRGGGSPGGGVGAAGGQGRPHPFFSQRKEGGVGNVGGAGLLVLLGAASRVA